MPILTRLLVVFLVLAGTARPAIGASDADKLKVAILYKIMQFVEWPDDGEAATNLPIHLCLLGADPFGGLLGQLEARPVRGRPLRVDYLANGPSGGTPKCHVVFISASERPRLAQVIGQLRGNDVLVVSDIDQFTDHGGMLGLNVEEGSVHININLNNLRKSVVKVSSKLLELARVER